VTPRTAAFTLASLLALALASDLLWMPVQVSDSLDEIIDARASPSAWASFTESLRSDDNHLRPLRVAQTKVLYDLAAGHYWLAYRGFHAALLVTAVLLFTAALRVSTATDAAAAALALVVFIGSRTFRGNIEEAFPVNHFLEVVVLCLLTLNLARSSRQAWWLDAAAVFALAAAALTLESGLLVWVVASGAWLVGWRGISRWGLVAMTAVLTAYVVLRLIYVASGTGLPDRSTGFGFTMLDPADLQQRFGDRALVLYAYNVAASALAVLFAEPRNGVFIATRTLMTNELEPWLVIPVVTSAVTTLLIVCTAAHTVRRSDVRDDTIRWIVLSTIVLVANAVVSYSYTKDEITGVAGAFYALAAFAAVRVVLNTATMTRSAATATAVTIVALLSIGWSVRAAGMHYLLRAQAFRHQNDWVRLPGMWQRSGRWPDDAAAQQLITTLREAAVDMDLPNPRVGERWWVARIWED